MKLKSKLLLALLATSSAAFAQTAPAAPEVTYNVGVVSQYRYRGLAQTKGQAALQGGVDYANANGAYLGGWLSTIRWIKDSSVNVAGGAANASYSGDQELDLYGGYKFQSGDIAYDVGYLRYQYLNNTLGNAGYYSNANTNEVYASASAGVYTFKWSYSLSNLFGSLNTNGSDYYDLSANFDMGNGITFTPHAGRQSINKAGYSYSDYSATLAKDMGDGLSLTLAYVTTSAKNNTNYVSNYTSYNAAKDAVVVGLKYGF